MYTNVTIIVGSYNQDQFIDRAVYSAKNQIVPDWRTGTLPSYTVKVSKDLEGIGASAHRNRAIEESNSDWIIWLDADDLLPSHYLYEMWNNGRFTRCFYFSPMQFVSGCRLDRIESLRFDQNLNYISTGSLHLPFGMSAMFTKQAWAYVGGFDHTLYNMNDLDFWIRLYKFGFRPEQVLTTYMFKCDVPGSLLKKGETKKDEILAQFNAKHGMNLKEKVLPYWVPSTTLL